MSQFNGDFFRYVPRPRETDVWGIAVTGGGRIQVTAGAPYPPAGHPADHSFAWENGRVLGAWQLVFVAAGRGQFESAHQPLIDVTAGSALLLFPGEWHRYRPDPKTGWTELWIELQGPALDRLQAGGGLAMDAPVQPLDDGETKPLFARLHSRLRENETSFDPELSAWAWQLLARFSNARQRARPAENEIARAVRRAETLLAERLDNPPAIPELARELGVAYSYFRREFRKRTGLAPAAYLLRLRLEKARRLLGNSGAPLKDIAEGLGFSSPYHLSAAFKQAFGVSPAHWRRRP